MRVNVPCPHAPPPPPAVQPGFRADERQGQRAQGRRHGQHYRAAYGHAGRLARARVLMMRSAAYRKCVKWAFIKSSDRGVMGELTYTLAAARRRQMTQRGRVGLVNNSDGCCTLGPSLQSVTADWSVESPTWPSGVLAAGPGQTGLHAVHGRSIALLHVCREQKPLETLPSRRAALPHLRRLHAGGPQSQRRRVRARSCLNYASI